MTLNAPSQLFFWVSLIVAVLGLIFYFTGGQAIAFWAALIGYIVLAVGCVMKPS